jgi:Domain of unknown function (DUF4157)
MPATRHARVARKAEEDAIRRAAPDADDVLAEQSQDGGTPALPDLNAGPLEPEAWLALQQTIGNSAVGGLVQRRRAGQPLPAKTRGDMEASFGRNFGQVQVHSGPEIDQAAQALDAAAFTVGDGIYMHSSLPGFEDPFGRAVLGEELAHVAQGVGASGVGRVTQPDETVEREARTAGRAAAGGRQATVSAAPAAAGAVARFDLASVLGAVADAVEAATVEKTELPDEEKDRLRAGALDPLNALWTQLGDKLPAAGGKLPAKALQPLVDNSIGIGKFINSFSGPAAIQTSIEQAAMSASAGTNALVAAIDPAQATKNVAAATATMAAEITALASAPSPAPAAAPSQTPPADAQADSLTPIEAEQLKLGAAEPLSSASEQLGGEQPDLDAIIARLKSVPGVLRSFSKPAALVPQLHKKAMGVEVAVRSLEAVQGGAQAAISTAMDEWRNAIGLLQGLTAKSAGGVAPTKAESPASGDDDDDSKKKAN